MHAQKQQLYLLEQHRTAVIVFVRTTQNSSNCIC